MAFDKTRFGGVVAPIVNPCGEDDSLDRGALEANLTRLLATDVAGLYINGGTGDAANLTQDERLETAALLVPRLLAAGKLAIVHVGQTNQRQAVELARQAAALGAHAVASIPPKKPWPQIVEYYKALATAGAPVIVYYIPGVTGMTAGMPELRMLLDIPGVVGIKMSDWNIFLLRSVVLEYPEMWCILDLTRCWCQAFCTARTDASAPGRICCPIYMQRYTRACARAGRTP